MTAVFSRSTVLFGPQVQSTIAPLAAVVGADETVPVGSSDRERVRYANLDYAASSPALRSVADAVTAALSQYASVHRGAGYLSQVTTERYEQARETVRRFVRGRVDDTVVFTRNTTDSINLAAHIAPGDVVVLDLEHHANLLPWTTRDDGRRTRVVRARPSVADTLTAIECELAAAPAALLAITGASNVTGEVLPIGKLAAIAHRAGARILVDAAQLVAHQPISVVSHGIDYLAFSGHKVYAPFGSGVLLGRSDWFDAAAPYLAGGGASASVRVADAEVLDSAAFGTDGPRLHVDWHPGAARHEAGSPNVLGAIAIAAACDSISELGFDAIGEHEAALRTRLDAGLRELAGVRPLQLFDDDTQTARVGIAAFAVDGRAPRAVAECLSDNYGIGVRDGKFCAHPLVTALGHTEGALRVSFGLGTGSDDIDRLLGALAEISRGGNS